MATFGQKLKFSHYQFRGPPLFKWWVIFQVHCLVLLPQNRQCSNIIVLFAEVKPLHIRVVAFIFAGVRAGSSTLLR